MLRIVEHIRKVFLQSADSDPRKRKQQENHCHYSRSDREKQESFQAEHIAAENKVELLFPEKQVDSHAYKKKNIRQREIRTAKYSARKAQSAENDLQLLAVVGGSDKNSRKRHKSHTQRVIAERHNVERSKQEVQNGAEYGNISVFAELDIDQR